MPTNPFLAVNPFRSIFAPYPTTGAPGPQQGDGLLLEGAPGPFLLLESGDFLLLE